MHIDWSLIHLFILWIYKAMKLSPSFFFKTTGNVHLVFLLPRLHQKKIPLNAFFLKIETVNFYCRDNYILRLLITWYKYRAVHSVHSGSSYCNLIINLTHGFFYLIRRKTKLYVLHIKMKFNITRFFVSQNDFLASLLIILLNTRKRQ